MPRAAENLRKPFDDIPQWICSRAERWLRSRISRLSDAMKTWRYSMSRAAMTAPSLLALALVGACAEDGDAHGEAAGLIATIEAGTSINPIVGIATGDIDGEGDRDMVIVGEAGALTFDVLALVNNGNDRFDTRTVVSIPNGVHSASVVLDDWDGDGDLDIVCSAALKHVRVFLYINDGAGNFSPA